MLLISESAERARVVDISLPDVLRVMRISQRFRKYLIYFRILDDERVEIVRVLHAARDVNTLLRSLVATLKR